MIILFYNKTKRMNNISVFPYWHITDALTKTTYKQISTKPDKHKNSSIDFWKVYYTC